MAFFNCETRQKTLQCKLHNHPKIIDAKKKELEKLYGFGALEEVDEGDQKNIVPTKWVVTEVENDDKGTKADLLKVKLVIRELIIEDVD